MRWIQKINKFFRNLFNARLYRRVPVQNIPIHISQKGNPQKNLEAMGNWSPGGILVLTKNIWPLETLVKVEFDLASKGSASIRLDGQIVRHQINPETQEVEGMGIMFTDFTQGGLAVLQDFLVQVEHSKKPTEPKSP